MGLWCDGTGLDGLTFRVASRVPNPGEREDGVVQHGEAERSFHFSVFAVGAFSDGKAAPAAGIIGEAALSGLLFLSRLSHDPHGCLAEVLAALRFWGQEQLRIRFAPWRYRCPVRAALCF